MAQGKELEHKGPAGGEGAEDLIARLSPAQQQEFYRVAGSLAVACSEAIRQVLEAMAGPAPAVTPRAGRGSKGGR